MSQSKASPILSRFIPAIAVVIMVGTVAMLAVAGIFSRSNAINSGDMVMFVAPGENGKHEWKGPFPVQGYTEDDRIAIDAGGETVVVDIPQAVPLELYRNRNQ